MKNAYVITKTFPEMPELAQMHLDTVRDYCQKNDYAILAGTTLTGQPTEDIVEEIMTRLQSTKPNVLVLYSGKELGRDVSTAFGRINRIRDMGIEVEAVRMEIPDRSMMSALSAVAAVFREMDAQLAEAEDFDEDYEEEPEEPTVRELPTPTAEHWDAEERFSKTSTPARKCAIYVRQNAAACRCDDMTLEEQCRQLHDYAQEQGYAVEGEVQACETSRDKDSVGLLLLKKVIAEKQVDSILVTSYEVFSEDAITCGEIVNELKNCGVDVEPIEECSLRIRATDFFQMR